MNITWLLHAAFLIAQNGQNVYIDPFHLKNNLPKADVVFVTHTHYDHLSPEDIRKVLKDSTVIVAPQDAEQQLKGIPNNKIFVKPGNEYAVGSLKIRTVPAYNIGKLFHPKSRNWVGYVITFGDETSFFHTGDSDNIPEYAALKGLHITVMAVAIGGTYTMNWKEAAEAVLAAGPKEAIPMHWGSVVGDRQDAEKFRDALKSGAVKVTIF